MQRNLSLKYNVKYDVLDKEAEPPKLGPLMIYEEVSDEDENFEGSSERMSAPT